MLFRRRRYLISPKFQVTLIAFNALLALFAILVFYGENLYLFSIFSGADTPELVTDPIISELIAEEQGRMRVIFAFTSLVVVATMIIGGLILSNRVAGPVYRLQNHMQEILNGSGSRKINFRDKDYFPELAETYNQLLQKLDSESRSAQVESIQSSQELNESADSEETEKEAV